MTYKTYRIIFNYYLILLSTFDKIDLSIHITHTHSHKYMCICTFRKKKI